MPPRLTTGLMARPLMLMFSSSLPFRVAGTVVLARMSSEKIPAGVVVFLLPGVPDIRFPDELDFDIVFASGGIVTGQARNAQHRRIVQVVRRSVQTQRLRGCECGTGIGRWTGPELESIIDRIQIEVNAAVFQSCRSRTAASFYRACRATPVLIWAENSAAPSARTTAVGQTAGLRAVPKRQR